MIDVRRLGSATVIALDRGKVNALDAGLLEGIVECLRQAQAGGARAVVLTGTGPVFSAGLDLRALVFGDDAYVARLISALSATCVALLECPLPTVAAINGAAVAGGCVLACACDRRLMVDTGARIGATELAIGMPFPVAPLEVLRQACGFGADEVVLGGQLHDAARATELGIIHETVPPQRLLARAVEVAEGLASWPGAFRLAKQQLRRPTLARIAADAPAVDPVVTRIWSDRRTRARIRGHLEALTTKQTSRVP